MGDVFDHEVPFRRLPLHRPGTLLSLPEGLTDLSKSVGSAMLRSSVRDSGSGQQQ